MAEFSSTVKPNGWRGFKLFVTAAAIGTAIAVPAPCSRLSVYGSRLPDEKDILDKMILNPSLKTFVNLVAKADMVEMVKSDGPYTIFAPSDDAFAKLPASLLTAIKKDKATLKKVLTYHMVAERMTSKDFKEAPMKSVEGETLTLNLKKAVKLNNAKLVAIDDLAANGVVHVIDTVLIPPSLGKKLSQLRSTPQ